jgi:hypothetical protein
MHLRYMREGAIFKKGSRASDDRRNNSPANLARADAVLKPHIDGEPAIGYGLRSGFILPPLVFSEAAI